MYVKFVFSGGMASMTHFIILITLTEVFEVHYLVSATIGYSVAFVVSFSLQKYWTFRDKTSDHLPKQAAMYFMVTITGLFVNTSMMYALVEWASIHYIVSQIITGATIAVGNFFVYRLIIFKKGKQDPDKEMGKTESSKKKLLIATPIFPPVIGGPALIS